MKGILIHNGRRPGDTAGAPADFWVLTRGERIAATGRGPVPDFPDLDETIDARGALVLPGMIDTHVHFREPGLTHKGTIASESAVAVLGGVTSFCEMPNTLPPTTTLSAWQEKMDIASRDSRANYAFYLGASASNGAELRAADPRRIPAVKLFIGSSTGDMAVTGRDSLDEVFRCVPESMPVMVHAEDDAIIASEASAAIERAGGNREDVPVEEHPLIRSPRACSRAVERAVRLARKHGKHLHVAHISGAAELDVLDTAPAGQKITAEATALHLTFAGPEDYQRLGARIKVNPAVKSAQDRKALIAAVREGRIHTLATDHAPHTLAEKQGGALSAASGAPSLQWVLPVLTDILGAETVEELYSRAPARIFKICDRGQLEPGSFADIVLLEHCTPYEVRDEDVASPCGWTPFTGRRLSTRVAMTMVNGVPVVRDGKLLPMAGNPAKALEFNR